ncbi:MAG: hypothetical protein BLM47_03160 [Candidatus Reconcilbacillus cellulovorans]|uniref:Uncharacterized protein n=1 Tax=Candidatus Reconcilbacillus cellulovorans TaxID=1906605 RepID=A0A2A6E1L4_9BACL|nr:MAG: hypothetical protein BLM47_03160 [Candidatus Reconcilbacillus cellulovorans]
MGKFKRAVGLTAGALMMLSVLSSIRIGRDLYLGQWALERLGLPFSKWAVAAVFVGSWLVWKAAMRGANPPWLNAARVALSLLMAAAMISYLAVKG